MEAERDGTKNLAASPQISAVMNMEATPAVLVPPESPAIVGAPARASKPREPEVTMAEVEVGPEPEKVQVRFLLSPLGAEAERGYLLTRKGRRLHKRLKIDSTISISSADMQSQIENHKDTSVTLSEVMQILDLGSGLVFPRSVDLIFNILVDYRSEQSQV